uniref:Thioredoxin domain-containing protein 17 n=1 Tax=Chelonoidis abingdonii TaxID=106734 RepID=A0A8C0GYG5_CHEAB
MTCRYQHVSDQSSIEFIQVSHQNRGLPIFAFFCGDKDDQGRSWCPDCVTAEPGVQSELNSLPNGSVHWLCQAGP